jgi:hypothetical protein
MPTNTNRHVNIIPVDILTLQRNSPIDIRSNLCVNSCQAGVKVPSRFIHFDTAADERTCRRHPKGTMT